MVRAILVRGHQIHRRSVLKGVPTDIEVMESNSNVSLPCEVNDNRSAPHSPTLLIEAVRVGAPYAEFASRLRKLAVRQVEPKASLLSVACKPDKPPTLPVEVTEVLPSKLLKMCGTKNPTFESKWKRTRGRAILRQDIVVIVCGIKYSMEAFDAMKNWYTILQRYDELDRALKQYRKTKIAVAVPANVIRMPHMDLELARGQSAFKFATAQAVPPAMVVNVNANPWCSVIVDLSTSTITVFDSQQCGDRLVALHKLIQDKIEPLFPPRHYRNRTYSTFAIRDNYNCGVGVLVFFEEFLSGNLARCVTGSTRDAMQYFRYRYLSKIIAGLTNK
ncbi:hypothetical protein PHYSODRAFT_304928 [Phytophthora sojae]|uniref:Ubiquitin-like protease family profile domain-containing protein n=1 Tax=Phytophthora sojae (strain P6497) TaxID=1094619 RepID=G5A3C9_PHYSP|nr:hypothetical protein PHYSODRAFT_304928 [Phytophthora sojae]EGZ09354.1 hypothetical protein PHYSODRAFT_304928 [Phytophthora sojae]|eukprot:XP_009534215.1 hypothetical protein PHYSODRAFT_304928 [Phytophthora sojae]